MSLVVLSLKWITFGCLSGCGGTGYALPYNQKFIGQSGFNYTGLAIQKRRIKNAAPVINKATSKCSFSGARLC